MDDRPTLQGWKLQQQGDQPDTRIPRAQNYESHFPYFFNSFGRRTIQNLFESLNGHLLEVFSLPRIPLVRCFQRALPNRQTEDRTFRAGLLFRCPKEEHE